MRSTVVFLILTVLFRSAWLWPKIEVQDSEISDEMKREALNAAVLAVNMYSRSSSIAEYIKKEMDRKYGGNWQCIIWCYGYYISYQSNHYIRFTVGDKKISNRFSNSSNTIYLIQNL